MEGRMKILFAYDGSECADAAIDDLRRAGLPHNAHIIVMAVAENWLPPPSSLEFLEDVDKVKEFKTLAQRAATRLHEIQAHGQQWEIETETPIGSAARLIVEKADRWKPDLIVVGSHGRTALGRFFFGTVSQKVLHEAHSSVRIARGRIDEPKLPLRLIIGIDGSKCANAAVAVVASRHWPEGTEVRLVNGMYKVPSAVSEPALAQIADWVAREQTKTKQALDVAARTLKSAGLKATIVVKDEEPKHLLCCEAEDFGADCIFVGSRGAGLVERFLIGSVSSAVAARAHCSVEVIRTL